MSTGRVARHCLLISLPMVRSIHIHPVRTGHHCTTIRKASTITMNCLLLSPRVAATSTQLAEPFDTFLRDTNHTDEKSCHHRRLHFLTDTVLTLLPSLGRFPRFFTLILLRYFFSECCNDTVKKCSTLRSRVIRVRFEREIFLSVTFIRPRRNVPL